MKFDTDASQTSKLMWDFAEFFGGPLTNLKLINKLFLNFFFSITSSMFGKQKQTTKWTISPIPGKENTDYDPSLYQNVQTVSYRTNVNYNNQQHSDSDESDETMDNHMLIDPFFEYQFRYGFCVLNFLSILSDCLSKEKLTQKMTRAKG